jgi:hypothetical protein
MTDYRTMYDKEHLGAWDLQGRDVTVTIEDVKAGQLVGEGGKKAKKPILRFVDKEKTMACNITNARTIAGMYGNDVRQWKGKRITIYPTMTQFGGKEMECIRVRPSIPEEKKGAADRAAASAAE